MVVLDVVAPFRELIFAHFGIRRRPLKVWRIQWGGICSVALGQRATISGTDQWLATSISQPHLVAPGAGEMTRAPLTRSGVIGSVPGGLRRGVAMPESLTRA
jgi:hypothetical protein